MDRLRELILETVDRRNQSLRELAESAGVSAATLSHILNKKVEQPSSSVLKKLAPLLGVSEDELLALAGHRPSERDHRPVSRNELLERLQAVDAIEVPIYDVDASASPSRGRINFDGPPVDYGYLPLRRAARAGRIRGLRIRGDCMEPQLHDGDQVFIDTQVADYQTGDVVAALVNDELHIKQLVAVGEGWALAPTNGEPALPVDDGVTVIGKVLGVWTQLPFGKRGT